MSAGAIIAQKGEDLTPEVAYTNAGVGATGLTVTVDVWVNGSNTLSAQSATEEGDGLYRFTLTGSNTTTAGRYTFVFKTAGTVDQAWQYCRFDVGGNIAQSLPAGVAPGAWGGLSRYSDVAQIVSNTVGTIYYVDGGINDAWNTAVANVGTPGTTQCFYQIIARSANGGKTIGYTTTAGTLVSKTKTGAATLNSTDYNVVSWPAVPNAVSYDVLKWDGSAFGSVSLAQSGVSYNDQGGAISAYVVPTTNTTSPGSDSAAGTASSPFATLAHAQSVAVFGDSVYAMAGWHAQADTQLAMPAGVNLRGAGKYLTQITSTVVLVSHVCVAQAPYSTYSDFTVDASLQDSILGFTSGSIARNKYRAPIGAGSADPSPVSAVMRNLNIVGNSDAYFCRTSSFAQMDAINCDFSTAYDCIRVSSPGGLFRFFRGSGTSIGPEIQETAGIARVVAASDTAPLVQLFDFKFYAANGGSGVTACVQTQGTAIVEIIRGACESSNVSGPAYDLFNAGGAIRVFGLAYTSSNGAITQILAPGSVPNAGDSPATQTEQATIAGIAAGTTPVTVDGTSLSVS